MTRIIIIVAANVVIITTVVLVRHFTGHRLTPLGKNKNKKNGESQK
jgi:hypothetical protein